MARALRRRSTLAWLFFDAPFQLIFVIAIVLGLLFFSWYLAYESVVEDTVDQLRMLVMISPLILLLLVRCLSAGNPLIALPRSGPNAIHRAGSSPWGVALLLLLLLLMISYQSSFHEQWFPLWKRD